VAYWPSYLRLTGRAYWPGLLWLICLVLCCFLIRLPAGLLPLIGAYWAALPLIGLVLVIGYWLLVYLLVVGLLVIGYRPGLAWPGHILPLIGLAYTLVDLAIQIQRVAQGECG